MTAHSHIENRILNASRAMLAALLEADSDLSANITAKGPCDLAINSSFLLRDKNLVKTAQSQRRVALTLRGDGSLDKVQVADGLHLNLHYRIESAIPDAIPLQEAVAHELGAIGDVIFVLIGTIRGMRASERALSTSVVKLLRLDPTISADFEMAGDTCALRTFLAVEDLLTKIKDHLPPGDVLSPADRQAIARAYDALIDEAVTDVVMPTGRPANVDETILGKIVGSLRGQASEYRAALGALEADVDDKQALNEVLRLAYNFSTDALPLISLFMSICDLKPLIFWCTLDRQWALSGAFASLPWSALGRKEKLQEYQSIVAAARNYAFHHILPFDATVEVDLSGVNVRAEQIRLFPLYGQKQQGGVRLKDQQLVDVLADFSRAKQRPVSVAFWRENLKVMEATADLAQGILDTLLLIHGARPSLKEPSHQRQPAATGPHRQMG